MRVKLGMSEIEFTAPSPSESHRREIEATTFRVMMGAVIFSLLFHSLTLGVLSHFEAYRPPAPVSNSIPVEFMPDANFKDAVETLQEASKETPQDSKFVSTKNLKADEDTSPESAASPMPRMGGPKSDSKNKMQAKKSEKIFTLSKNDLVAEAESEKETLTPGGDGLSASPGFYERLKRGEQFKVSATESDYAQYITRMKNKLIDRWSPQKFVQPGWSQFVEVRVDVAVVLDRRGEIVDLKIVGASPFKDFDQEAIRALKEGGPYPNPPKSLIQDDGLVYMPWSFALYMKSWGVAGRGVE